MEINLAEFVPKYIGGKSVAMGLPGEKYHIGRKIKNFDGKLSSVIIKNIENIENPKLKILNALLKRDMSLNELSSKTKLSYENLRWHIIRSEDSLLNRDFVRIKEKIFFPHKNVNGGVIKTIFMASDKDKNHRLEIKQENPKRKELVLLNLNSEEFILSSWWNSWLKPEIKNLEFNYSENRFLYKIPENHILIQYEKSKNILYSTILPKNIEVDDEQFITTLGLLLGEMRIRESDISFSNTEPFLANYVLNSLEYFGLTREDFRFSIQVNTKNFKPNHEDLIGYWSKELKIGKNKLSNIFEYENYGTNRGRFGRIDFIYWNIVLKEIINNLTSYFIKNSDKNQAYAVYIIRGLLAAEGYIEKSKSGALGRIGISSCSEQNKLKITRLLKRLNIRSSIQDNAVRIYSRKNFDRVKEYDLLKVSKDKKRFNELSDSFVYKKKLIPF